VDEPVTTPSIVTQRLELRPLASGDVEDVFRYASDPAVAANTAWTVHRTLEDARRYVQFVVGAHSDEAGSFRRVWAIRLAGEPMVVGTIDLVQDDPATAHIDFALAQHLWGRGIITEATRSVVRWGFDHLPELKEIQSGGLSRNVGTMRVLEKVGFRLRARSNVARPPKFPEPLEASHFSLTRESFLESGRAT
jgi:[ribosomal protein S5]-alanine N-acetyltransferase